MNLQNLIISIILFAVLFVILKKFNILVDNTNYSDHKKLGNQNKSPIILGGIYLVSIFFIFFPNEYLLVKILSISILILGLLSDINLFSNPKIRLIFQIFIIFILVNLEKLTINNLSVDFINNLLNQNVFNIFFTVFCFAVLLNGSNFLDGLNGLLSGYCLLVLGSLIYVDLSANYIEIIDIELIKVLFTALLVFYIFNFFGLVYLGDGGSYVISMIMGIILIKAHMDNIYISPYYIAAVLWYPAFENLFSLVRRIFKKSDVSSPDKLHLHQLIFRYLKIKNFFKQKYLNTTTSIIILILNLPIFMIASLNYSHTESLIVALIVNIAFYLLIYFFLSKNFIVKK